MLTIRPATWEDLDAMVSLLQALFVIENDFPPDPDRQRRGLKRFLDGCGKHRRILVAEADGRVIAMATVQILISTAEGGHVGLVEDVVVREDCRNRGVGRRLMSALGSWAAERGLKRLQLLADRGNQPALDFYDQLGWQPTRLICLRKVGVTDMH
ncbi:MAG: GNAT family N-acetyltransferase [Desulfosarcina sp.]|nr:GNAT family N-acetyltransferase [Desulfobacterales bacterium]